jgi:hypothetical protein
MIVCQKSCHISEYRKIYKLAKGSWRKQHLEDTRMPKKKKSKDDSFFDDDEQDDDDDEADEEEDRW